VSRGRDGVSWARGSGVRWGQGGGVSCGRGGVSRGRGLWGVGRAGGRRGRLYDEAGGLLSSQRVSEAVDLVLQRHEHGDDVRQRLVVLADHEQDVPDVLTQLCTRRHVHVHYISGDALYMKHVYAFAHETTSGSAAVLLN